jgi:ferric-dicitrate binding protein FerR (iron transport regulator)
MANIDSRQSGARPIEPLSDAAWSRVEAGLFARIDRGEHLAAAEAVVESAPASTRRRTRPASRRWGFVLAFAAAAAAAAVWVQTSVTSSEPLARVEAQRQEATPGPAQAPARATAAAELVVGGERVADGALLATSEESKRWRVGDSEVTLAAGSKLAVAGSDAVGFQLTLERGRVDCEVAPRAGRPAFVVNAGDATVTVVGTRFSVSRDAAGASVRVEHGSVRVATPATSVLLGAGESWPAPDAAPLDDEATAARVRDVPSPARARPVRSGASAAARFDRATRLEARSPDAALRIYRDLSSKPGPWAPNALYAAGRLELERQRTQRGRALLERYLKRYPEGANAADARALLERR